MNKETKLLLAKGQKLLTRGIASVTAGNIAVLQGQLMLMKKAPQ